jgi:hypothetical protein
MYEVYSRVTSLSFLLETTSASNPMKIYAMSTATGHEEF